MPSASDQGEEDREPYLNYKTIITLRDYEKCIWLGLSIFLDSVAALDCVSQYPGL